MIMAVCCPRCGVWQRAPMWHDGVAWWVQCAGCGAVRWRARLFERVREGVRPAAKAKERSVGEG